MLPGRIIAPCFAHPVPGPMFDNRVSILGVPAALIELAAAMVAAVIGLLWLRRILTIEPEVHSFRATSDRWRSWIAIVVAIVAALAVLALLLAPALLR